MAIQSDNLGFLIGKPINLNRQDRQLDEIEKNTKDLVTLFKDWQKIERRIVTTKPVIQRISIEKIIERNVKAGTPNKGLPTPTGGRVTVDSIMVQNAVKKANAQAKIAKQTPVIPMRKERPIIVKQNGGNVDLLPKAKAHTATLGARNAQGQFVSTQKPAITPYGKSAAGVISRQMEKNEFKEKRQWRIDLFKFMRKSDKDQRRERKKSDGLLSKIAGKAMGGARYVMGRAATGLFGGGVMGELAGMATGGMGMLGTGGRILGGAGKFLLKNPIGRMLALGGLAFGASKAFGSGGTDDDKQNVAKSAGGIVGGAGGWMAGAAIGQAVIPIPVVGAIVGGLAGAFAGDSIGEKVGELLYKKDWKRGWDKVRNGMSWSFTGMTNTIKTVSGYAWDGMRSLWDTTWTGVGALFPNMTKNIEGIFTSMKENVVSAAQTAWGAIGSAADAVKNSSVGQAIGSAADAVKNSSVGQAIGSAADAVSEFLSGAGFAMTQKYDALKYKMGGKSLNGAIDCSGWTFQVSKMEMEGINKKARMEIFSQKDINALNTGAVEQIAKIAQENGIITSTRNGKFDKTKLMDGMSIGQYKHGNKYSGRTASIGGRNERLNHIVKVVKDPKTGKLMISESRGGDGVTLTDVDSWVDMREKRGDTLIAVDALKKARGKFETPNPVAITRVVASSLIS